MTVLLFYFYLRYDLDFKPHHLAKYNIYFEKRA